MLGFDQVGRAPECGNPLELEERAPARFPHWWFGPDVTMWLRAFRNSSVRRPERTTPASDSSSLVAWMLT
jgi:hypothetical protein